jgi:hypothetical protein
MTPSGIDPATFWFVAHWTAKSVDVLSTNPQIEEHPKLNQETENDKQTKLLNVDAKPSLLQFIATQCSVVE